MAKNKFLARWFACRITSGWQSARYGLRFSYPIYICLVTSGILLVNPAILSITAFVAFLGIVLPMHPFDYVYNYTVPRLPGVNKIPGRGTEMQVTSLVAFIFNILAIVSIILDFQLNYPLMAIIYIASSVFFIALQLSQVTSKPRK